MLRSFLAPRALALRLSQATITRSAQSLHCGGIESSLNAMTIWSIDRVQEHRKKHFSVKTRLGRFGTRRAVRVLHAELA